jgi:hypothetical protein
MKLLLLSTAAELIEERSEPSPHIMVCQLKVGTLNYSPSKLYQIAFTSLANPT